MSIKIKGKVKITPEAIDDAKKAIGAHPYDGPTNYLVGDGYFHQDCVRRHGAEVWGAACDKVAKAWREHLTEFKV